MPRGDGDGVSIDTDGELLAQIIPLRRREREPHAPEILADEPAGPLDEPEALRSSSAERSVWDEPSVELRRRAPNGASAKRGPTADTRSSGHGTPARLLSAAAAIAAAGAIAVVAALLLGGTAARPTHRPAASRLVSRTPTSRLTAQAPSHTQHSTAAHQRTHPRPHTALTRVAQSSGTKSATPPATAGSSTPVQEGSAAENTIPSSSSQAPAPSAPAADSGPVASPTAENASANRAFGFER